MGNEQGPSYRRFSSIVIWPDSDLQGLRGQRPSNRLHHQPKQLPTPGCCQGKLVRFSFSFPQPLASRLIKQQTLYLPPINLRPHNLLSSHQQRPHGNLHNNKSAPPGLQLRLRHLHTQPAQHPLLTQRQRRLLPLDRPEIPVLKSRHRRRTK